jgi:hypothetical protein
LISCGVAGEQRRKGASVLDMTYNVAGHLRQLGRAFYNDAPVVILKLLPRRVLLVGYDTRPPEWKMLSGSSPSLAPP